MISASLAGSLFATASRRKCRKIIAPMPTSVVMTPAFISFKRLCSGVTPRRRSRSSSVMNISATQVFDQSN